MFLARRFFIALVTIVILFALAMLLPPLFVAAQVALAVLVALTIADGVMIYTMGDAEGRRSCPQRLSNGDDNEVTLTLTNRGRMPLRVRVTDETPPQFQLRHLNMQASLPPHSTKRVSYILHPTQRGQAYFGFIRMAVTTPLRLVERSIRTGEEQAVAVYPSFLMMRKMEIMSIHNNLTDIGIKRIRRKGNNTDFEHIKDYVKGDDYRTINWKASARRHQLMVNVYQDERSQQVLCAIDKGRLMQQAFNGMTLLDYAINAALMLSYIALNKDDMAGVITFAEHFDDFVPPRRRHGQLQNILECLYRQQTSFGEADYSDMVTHVNTLVRRRSFMVLFTSFMGMNSLQRQLPYLVQLNRRHRLLVVFFADSELEQFMATQPSDTEDYYQHVMAEKMDYEKRLIVSTLQQHGIYSLLTAPDMLTVDVVNKYLEMKNRNLLT